MSRKWTRVYICDWCQTIERPKVYYQYIGIDMYSFKDGPRGWQRVGKMDLCDKCFAKFSKIMGEGEEKDNAED